MPLYRFQIHSGLDPRAVQERAEAVMREAPTLRQMLKDPPHWGPDAERPFFGEVDGRGFTCTLDVRHPRADSRNSRNYFRPRGGVQITGRVEGTRTGSRIDVAMSPHALMVMFVVVWVGIAGATAAYALWLGGGTAALFPLGMLAAGVALAAGGFYPEAIKARRALEQHLGLHDP